MYQFYFFFKIYHIAAAIFFFNRQPIVAVIFSPFLFSSSKHIYHENVGTCRTAHFKNKLEWRINFIKNYFTQKQLKKMCFYCQSRCMCVLHYENVQWLRYHYSCVCCIELRVLLHETIRHKWKKSCYFSKSFLLRTQW